MDLLSELLQQAGLRRRLLDLRQLSDRTALRFPCEKSIGLHVVTHGVLHLHAPALPEPLTLNAGDIALMARGCEHVLSTQRDLATAQVETVATSWGDAEAAGAPDGGSAVVISGAYQLWNTPLHPLFRELPDWHVVRAAQLSRLGPLVLTIGLLDDEVRGRSLGYDTIVHGLLDVIFMTLLRQMVEARGAAGAGWSHAVRDPQVRRAVLAMHEDCARAWTLDELASHAGLSRTSLAQRFRDTMGDTPLSYLRTVRLQKAMRLLGETGHNLEQVALSVGYQDAFSFSKVFKRVLGVAPKEFRRRDAEERQLPWRLSAG
jgi:AraC-like DNA-binding protein